MNHPYDVIRKDGRKFQWLFHTQTHADTYTHFHTHIFLIAFLPVTHEQTDHHSTCLITGYLVTLHLPFLLVTTVIFISPCASLLSYLRRKRGCEVRVTSIKHIRYFSYPAHRLCDAEARVIVLHLIYWAPPELLFNLSKIVLSWNCGTSNLIAADIEPVTATEQAGSFLYRNDSDTTHD